MPFNIETFKSAVNFHGGLLKSSKFKVQFIPPIGLNKNRETLRELEFFCEQVNMPGVNLSFHDVRRYGYGPVEKRPIGHTFTDLQLTFMLTGSGDVHKIMHDWISLVSPYDMRDGINSRTANGNFPFLLNYKQDYITDLRIKVYNELDQDGTEYSPVTEMVIREAFPIATQEINLGWMEYNNIAKMGVQFAYVDWHLENSDFTKTAK